MEYIHDDPDESYLDFEPAETVYDDERDDEPLAERDVLEGHEELSLEGLFDDAEEDFRELEITKTRSEIAVQHVMEEDSRMAELFPMAWNIRKQRLGQQIKPDKEVLSGSIEATEMKKKKPEGIAQIKKRIKGKPKKPLQWRSKMPYNIDEPPALGGSILSRLRGRAPMVEMAHVREGSAVSSIVQDTPDISEASRVWKPSQMISRKISTTEAPITKQLRNFMIKKHFRIFYDVVLGENARVTFGSLVPFFEWEEKDGRIEWEFDGTRYSETNYTKPVKNYAESEFREWTRSKGYAKYIRSNAARHIKELKNKNKSQEQIKKSLVKYLASFKSDEFMWKVFKTTSGYRNLKLKYKEYLTKTLAFKKQDPIDRFILLETGETNKDVEDALSAEIESAIQRITDETGTTWDQVKERNPDNYIDMLEDRIMDSYALRDMNVDSFDERAKNLYRSILLFENAMYERSASNNENAFKYVRRMTGPLVFFDTDLKKHAHRVVDMYRRGVINHVDFIDMDVLGFFPEFFVTTDEKIIAKGTAEINKITDKMAKRILDDYTYSLHPTMSRTHEYNPIIPSLKWENYVNPSLFQACVQVDENFMVVNGERVDLSDSNIVYGMGDSGIQCYDLDWIVDAIKDADANDDIVSDVLGDPINADIIKRVKKRYPERFK